MEKGLSMEIVSRRERYAVLACVRLALATPGEPVSAREISDFGHIPIKVTEQVLHGLRWGGVALSRRGRAGGYSLARGADLVSVADVVGAVSGSHGGIGRMPDADPDPELLVEPIVRRAEQAARDVLASATLADLVTRTAGSSMYYI
jgi:Rrf2 family protein